MKEVWFYTYYGYKDIGTYEAWYEKTGDILYSKNFDSFEEAWRNRSFEKFPASPVLKRYILES